MTFEEAESVLKRFTFPGPIKIRFSLERIGTYSTYIHAYLDTMNRTDVAEPVTISCGNCVRLTMINEDTLKQVARAEALKLWVHEFDEWLRFDGELVQDPHLG